ncbi:hypothetical protein J6590_027714 [Homalodisca vitripennis]|nr:hypothetical protein J6590_027714 [Homalodisca vitripennis]
MPPPAPHIHMTMRSDIEDQKTEFRSDFEIRGGPDRRDWSGFNSPPPHRPTPARRYLLRDRPPLLICLFSFFKVTLLPSSNNASRGNNIVNCEDALMEVECKMRCRRQSHGFHGVPRCSSTALCPKSRAMTNGRTSAALGDKQEVLTMFVGSLGSKADRANIIPVCCRSGAVSGAGNMAAGRQSDRAVQAPQKPLFPRSRKNDNWSKVLLGVPTRSTSNRTIIWEINSSIF